MKHAMAFCALMIGMSWALPVWAQQFTLVNLKTSDTKPDAPVTVFKKGDGCGIKGQIDKSKLAARWSNAVFVGLWKECGLAGFAFGGTDLWFRIDDVQTSDPDGWLKFVTDQGPKLTCIRPELIGKAGNPTMNSAVARGFCN